MRPAAAAGSSNRRSRSGKASWPGASFYQQRCSISRPWRTRLPGRSAPVPLGRTIPCSLGAWCEGLTGVADRGMRRCVQAHPPPPLRPSGWFAQRWPIDPSPPFLSRILSFDLALGRAGFMERWWDGDLLAKHVRAAVERSSGMDPKTATASSTRTPRRLAFDCEGTYHPSLAADCWPRWATADLLRRAPSRPRTARYTGADRGDTAANRPHFKASSTRTLR